jgi:FtsZ-interacting cell division protein ZipA
MTWITAIALIVVAALGFRVWWRHYGRPGNRRVGQRGRNPDRDPEIGPIADTPHAQDADIDPAMAGGRGLVTANREGRTETRSVRRRQGRTLHPAQMDLTFAEASAPGDASGNADAGVVVSIHVQTRDRPVSGPDLLQHMAAVDLRYGDMAIFHHYGVGRMSSGRPLFSVANMYEPGVFDLDQIESFTTTGLSFFMTTSTRVDPGVVFELMLNTAQRLAEALEGEVLDDARQPLTQRAIDQLRARVKTHDRSG